MLCEKSPQGVKISVSDTRHMEKCFHFTERDADLRAGQEWTSTDRQSAAYLVERAAKEEPSSALHSPKAAA